MPTPTWPPLSPFRPGLVRFSLKRCVIQLSYIYIYLYYIYIYILYTCNIANSQALRIKVQTYHKYLGFWLLLISV